MHFDMVCACGAALQVISASEEQDTYIHLLISRFTNAHVKCGFMTEFPEETQTRTFKDINITERNEQ